MEETAERCDRGLYLTHKGHSRDLHSMRTQHGDILYTKKRGLRRDRELNTRRTVTHMEDGYGQR
jgi:hypothetical protein